jgi:hypothetical protein
VKVGDTIMIALSILKLKGISGNETVSNLGNNNPNGLADSKVMSRFTSYVNDNAMNKVDLPFCGSNRKAIFAILYDIEKGTTCLFPELDSIYSVINDGANPVVQGNSVPLDRILPKPNNHLIQMMHHSGEIQTVNGNV